MRGETGPACRALTWLSLSCAASSSLLSGPAEAQEIIKSYGGVWDKLDAAPGLDFIEDLDGDGYGELVVGDAAWGAGGRIVVLSGDSGNPIYEEAGPPGAYLGKSVANVGDMNGDGVSDIAGVGGSSSSTGVLWVLSGKDGSFLCQDGIAGLSVAALDDLNDDDLEGFVVGRYRLANVFLGSRCPPYYSVPSTPGTYYYGWATVGLGDVTGDGVPDFAVGAPGSADEINCFPGYVAVYSGANGTLIYDLYGESKRDLFGWSLAAPGDLDGDGITDLVVGARGADDDSSCKYGGPGRIYFFSGSTGARIDRISVDTTYAEFGRELVSVGDANGNGFPDVLVSVYNYGTLPEAFYEAWLIDGGTRETIYELSSPYGLEAWFGLAMTGVGDWNEDDFPDFLAGGSTTNPTLYPGRLDLYSGAPIGVSTFGTACATAAGTLPRIGATGSPKIGTDYDVHLSHVAPGATGILTVGLSNATWRHTALPLRLGFVGLPGCALQVSVDRVYIARAKAVGPGKGAATVSLPIANDPGLVGSSIFTQWLVLDPLGVPGGGAATRGLELTFQP